MAWLMYIKKIILFYNAVFQFSGHMTIIPHSFIGWKSIHGSGLGTIIQTNDIVTRVDFGFGHDILIQ